MGQGLLYGTPPPRPQAARRPGGGRTANMGQGLLYICPPDHRPPDDLEEGGQQTWVRVSCIYAPPDHRPPDDLEEGGQQTWVRVSCIYGTPQAARRPGGGRTANMGQGLLYIWTPPPHTHTHTTTVRTDLNIPKQLPGKFRRILPCRLCNTPISMC